MRRIIRGILWLTLLVVVLAGTSYIAARAKVAVFLGSPLPELGPRDIRFNFDGISQVAGNPRAWTFTYGPGQLPGTPQFQVFVSPTGRLVGTLPRDLQARIERFQNQRLNP
jgi:hypothetical protein